jgi:hypothetical protein
MMAFTRVTLFPQLQPNLLFWKSLSKSGAIRTNQNTLDLMLQLEVTLRTEENKFRNPVAEVVLSPLIPHR